jgi:hypothetical protein
MWFILSHDHNGLSHIESSLRSLCVLCVSAVMISLLTAEAQRLRRDLVFLVFADVLLELFSIGIIRFFLEQLLVFDDGLIF